MIINIAYPRNGTQKSFEYKEEKDWAKLYDRRLGEEISGDLFGKGFDGYIFKITGGNDKNGFSMKQGVATANKQKLLLAKGSVGYFCHRNGVRIKRTVRGCIIGPEITAINMILVQKGEKELEGLTDITVPLRLGPKRANKIRKLFNMPRHSDNIGVKDPKKISVSNVDVCRAVVKRITKKVGDKTYYKAPRITRLLTATRLRRKKVKKQKRIRAIQTNIEREKGYKKMLESRREKKEKNTKKKQQLKIVND